MVYAWYMLVQVIGIGCLVQVESVQVVTCYWYRLFGGRLIGIGSYRLLVQFESDRLTVEVVDSVIVTGCLHLAFIFQGGWTGQGQVVVAIELRGL
jgi:hypothetical protein